MDIGFDFDDISFGGEFMNGEELVNGCVDLASPLEMSARASAQLSGLPEPAEIVNVPNFANSGMYTAGTDDFADDIRVGDDARVIRQELAYGPGGSLPESLHEDAHRLPEIRRAGEMHGPHFEENLCDIRAGVLSGHAGVPRGAFRGEIGGTNSGPDHPSGCDRVPYFERAYDLASGDPFGQFVHPDENPFLQMKIRDLEEQGLRQFGC